MPHALPPLNPMSEAPRPEPPPRDKVGPRIVLFHRDVGPMVGEWNPQVSIVASAVHEESAWLCFNPWTSECETFRDNRFLGWWPMPEVDGTRIERERLADEFWSKP